ncbi:MAG TPA: hypothetical protein VMJ10_21285 [Kofleriaceae bacterium]|nr:hypothetical protein [Kofleriaceae bacterium]
MRRAAGLLLAIAACGRLHFASVDRTDAEQVDAVPCTPAAAHPTLSAITGGQIVLGAPTSDLSIAMSVPIASSILFTSLAEAEPSPTYGGVMCMLSAVALDCQRTTAGTDYAASDGVITVQWTIVTFSDGVEVRRGTARTPTTVTLTQAVDLASSFVLLDGVTGDVGTGWGDNEFVRGTLTDPQTLELDTFTAGVTVGWQIVTMTGTSVQRGTATLDTATTDQAITGPGPAAGEIVLASYTADNTASETANGLMLAADIAPDGSALLDRDAPGPNLAAGWEVVSTPFAVERGTIAMTAGQTDGSAAAPGVTPTTTVAFAGSEAVLGQAGGSTGFDDMVILDLLGEAAATFVVSPDTVLAHRHTALSTAEIPWQAIDFSRDRCAAP